MCKYRKVEKFECKEDRELRRAEKDADAKYKLNAAFQHPFQIPTDQKDEQRYLLLG